MRLRKRKEDMSFAIQFNICSFLKLYFCHFMSILSGEFLIATWMDSMLFSF
jgi:hypothetical protein